MDLNIIYDNRWDKDYGRLLGEFIEQGITKYKFWDAIVNKDSVVGSINASHKMIVRWAKENGLKDVAIAEQDLHFTAPDAWQYFLKNKPEDYDIYLASTYILPISNNRICGFHLYILNERFYDSFLSVPDLAHIDTAVCDLKGKYVFCYPFPALQRAGFSANCKAEVNYNGILEPKDIYKG